MNRNRCGYYYPSGRYEFYIMLPPDKWESPIVMDDEMIALEKEAMGTAVFENDKWCFNGAAEDEISDKESIASCKIESIESDSHLVRNYKFILNRIDNMNLDEETFLRVFSWLMMSKDMTDSNAIGKYRDSLVQVGELTPAPYWEIEPLMKELFDFMYSSRMNIMLKAAIVHVWFETIHPFRDGNGRMGRILIMWMLLKSGLSDDLIQCICLSPSTYFLENQKEYYERLNKVRTEGDIEGWIKFFLKSIRED